MFFYWFNFLIFYCLVVWVADFGCFDCFFFLCRCFFFSCVVDWFCWAIAWLFDWLICWLAEVDSLFGWLRWARWKTGRCRLPVPRGSSLWRTKWSACRRNTLIRRRLGEPCRHRWGHLSIANLSWDSTFTPWQTQQLCLDWLTPKLLPGRCFTVVRNTGPYTLGSARFSLVDMSPCIADIYEGRDTRRNEAFNKKKEVSVFVFCCFFLLGLCGSFRKCLSVINVEISWGLHTVRWQTQWYRYNLGV